MEITSQPVLVYDRIARNRRKTWLLVAFAIASLAPFVFGREFEGVGPALVLLLPGMVACGVWQLLASHLLRIGRRGFLAVTAWLFGLASIGLQAVGAQLFGLPGVAAGLSLAYALATIVCLIAIVAWIADQTLRDVQHIRRNWQRRRP